ncbi:unnamed protein product, partial [Microthlaspi erraticum]
FGVKTHFITLMLMFSQGHKMQDQEHFCRNLLLTNGRALCFMLSWSRLTKDHLFKRSIILVKAWCCYESRFLGANTELISTYALAILVLYR